MLKFKVLIMLIVCKMCQQVANCDDNSERPFLRIVAPQFLCGDKSIGNNSEPDNQNDVTIVLQTREGQKLRYQISVDFELIDEKFISQRHTLSIWRNIRNLQKKFFSQANEISDKNQIEINANELTPQVVYTFRITGIDEKNRTSETQNVNITFKNGEIKTERKDNTDGVSLLLYAPETIYVDMEFLAVAEVLFCDPINEYTFQWSLSNGVLENEISKLSGKRLQLSADILQRQALSLQFVKIDVKVLNKNSEVMSSSAASVRFIGRNFNIQNIPLNASVGINREIPIEILAVRQQNFKIDEIQLSCELEGTNECPAVLNGQHVTFSSTGMYQVLSKLSKENITKVSSSLIEVNPNIIPHVQVKHFPMQPINVMKTNQIVVTVLDLVPKCIATWEIHDDKVKDQSNFTNLGSVVVKDMVENFLQEIEDYDNSTISKDVTLTIREDLLSPTLDSYSFRLSVSCPELLTSNSSNSDNSRGVVTSYFDIAVFTNAPPTALPLEISPMNGVPMLDKFTFFTGSAKDNSIDFPLLYTFGYVVDGNVSIVIGTFYENSAARTQLPYSDDIATYFEVCDNNKACKRIDGPKIAANLTHKYSNEEIQFKLVEFDTTLKRGDYDDAMNLAAVILMTLRKVEGFDGKSEEQKIMESMRNEINRLKKRMEGSKINCKLNIDFVEMSRKITSFLNIDEILIKEILSLDDGNDTSRVKRTTSGDRGEPVDLNSVISHMKNILTLSGMLFTSKNLTLAKAEKKNFVEKIHQFLPSICSSKDLNSERVDVNYLRLEVSKVFSPQIFIESQKIPGNATILFSKDSKHFPKKFICIAKMEFSYDFFSDNETVQPVYETVMYDKHSQHNLFEILSANELSDFIMIELPPNDSLKSCLILKSPSIWSSNDCTKIELTTSDKIVCKCRTNEVNKILIKLGAGNQINSSSTKTPDVSPSSTTHDDSTEFPTTTTTWKSNVLTQSTSGNENSTSTSSIPHDGSLTSPHVSESTPSGITETSNPHSGTKNSTHIQTEMISSQSIAPTTEMSRISTIFSTTSNSFSSTKTSSSSYLPTSTTTMTNENKNNESSNSYAPTDMLTTTLASTVVVSTHSMELDTSTTTFSNEVLLVNKTDTKNSTNEEIIDQSSVSVTMISFLVGLFLLILVVFLIYACRQYLFTKINLPMRNPSDGIRYAKYHDEFSLRG